MHWRRKWRPTPVFLPEESQGRRSLVGCRLWGRTESDTTEVTYQQQQQAGHSFSSKEQASFNFMAAIIICSHFGAQKNKVSHCFHCFTIYFPRSDGTRYHSNFILSLDQTFNTIQSSNREKAMATHSSTLAWKIPRAEEPGRLQSMGLLRVGHD